MTDIPHLAFPLRLDADGTFAEVDQDSGQHMLERVHLTIRTPVGERLDDPTFGVPEDVLRVNGPDLDALADALTESEPDIPIEIGTADTLPDGHPLPGTDPRTSTIRIQILEES